MKRYSVFLAVMTIGLLFLSGCDKKPAETPGKNESLTQGQSTASVAGISWTVPGRWSIGGQRQMRVATYTVPSPDGSADAAECAVFYFGQSEGGDVESNMTRWIGQFEDAGEPQQTSREVDGMDVHVIRLSGTYVGMGGPMAGAHDKSPEYRLLGAIIEGPEGSVFFKMTGPESTVTAADAEFSVLIQSVKKQ